MKLTEYKSVQSEIDIFQGIEGFIENLIIDNDEIAQIASDNIDVLNKSIKRVKEQRLKMTRPLDASKSEIMRQQREVTDPMEKLVTLIDKPLTKYQIERRRIEEEKQRMLQQIETERLKKIRDEQLEQAEEAQSELAMSDAIATQGIINVVANIEIKGSGVVKETTGLSTSYLVDHYVFKVEDKLKVPAMYMTVNESMINKHINGQGRVEEIPGLLIINEPRRRTRGR